MTIANIVTKKVFIQTFLSCGLAADAITEPWQPM